MRRLFLIFKYIICNILVYLLISSFNPFEHTAVAGANFEGCSHGFWKNHTGLPPKNQTNEWCATYAPGDAVEHDHTFNIHNDYKDNTEKATLLEALKFKIKGGKFLVKPDGSARILLQQAVAALLNACVLHYPQTEQEIIDDVNELLSISPNDVLYDRSAIIALAAQLDQHNNLSEECPTGAVVADGGGDGLGDGGGDGLGDGGGDGLGDGLGDGGGVPTPIPIAPVVIIPTMGQWGMIFATVLLGFFAVRMLRNRKDSEN